MDLPAVERSEKRERERDQRVKKTAKESERASEGAREGSKASAQHRGLIVVLQSLYGCGPSMCTPPCNIVAVAHTPRRICNDRVTTLH